jgi:UrcA family protein
VPAAEVEMAAVTIRADRPTEKVVARGSSRIPIVQYELSYRVSYDDLDLATGSGADALKERVQEAAKSVCRELYDFYPQADPDRFCATKAASGAMPQVDAAIAAARKQ